MVVRAVAPGVSSLFDDLLGSAAGFHEPGVLHFRYGTAVAVVGHQYAVKGNLVAYFRWLGKRIIADRAVGAVAAIDEDGSGVVLNVEVAVGGVIHGGDRAADVIFAGGGGGAGLGAQVQRFSDGDVAVSRDRGSHRNVRLFETAAGGGAAIGEEEILAVGGDDDRAQFISTE